MERRRKFSQVIERSMTPSLFARCAVAPRVTGQLLRLADSYLEYTQAEQSAFARTYRSALCRRWRRTEFAVRLGKTGVMPESYSFTASGGHFDASILV